MEPILGKLFTPGLLLGAPLLLAKPAAIRPLPEVVAGLDAGALGRNGFLLISSCCQFCVRRYDRYSEVYHRGVGDQSQMTLLADFERRGCRGGKGYQT